MERSESQLLELFAVSLFEWSQAWGFTISLCVAPLLTLLIPYSRPFKLFFVNILLSCVHAIYTQSCPFLIILLYYLSKKNKSRKKAGGGRADNNPSLKQKKSTS